MKKVLITALVVLAGAAAATPYYIGTLAKKRFEQAHIRMQQELFYPQLSVAAGEYQQGWLHSEASTVLIFTPEKKDKAPLVFKLVHHVSNVPSLSSRSMMRVESELVLPDEMAKAVKPYFHGKPVLSAHSLVGFDGSETSTITSPSYSGPLEDDPSGRLEWGGLTATTSSDALFRTVTVTLDVPAFTLDKQDGALQLEKLHYSTRRQRGQHDLWFGHDEASLDEIQFNAMSTKHGPANMHLTRMQMSSKQAENGPLVNINGHFTFDSANLNGLTLKNGVYDIAYNNLDAASLATLSSRIREGLRQKPDDPRQLIAALTPLFQALLSKKPELAISELKVETPLGKINGKLKASLNDKLSDEIMQNPRGLMDIMNIDIDVSVPKQMVIGMIGTSANNAIRRAAKAQKKTFTEEELLQKVNAATQQKIEQMLSQKLMVDDGDNFATVIHYVPQQLILNGRDASPMLNGLQQK